MVNIGDVFAIVSVLLGIGVTSWALMVSCMLLFPSRVDRATAALQSRPISQIGLGLLVFFPGFVGAIMLGQPFPLGKLMGWLLILGVLAVGAVGAAGLGQFAGRRLQTMSSGLEDYPAFIRGCGFLVAASMLPLLGWFLFAPMALLASLGAGARAVAYRPVRPPVIAGAM